MVVLEVLDNGIGMIDDVWSCIFELFFIIKGLFIGGGVGGIGLGLYICYGILVSYNVELEVVMVLGEGIWFVMVFLRFVELDEGGK